MIASQRVRWGYMCQVLGSAWKERWDTLPAFCPLNLAVPTPSDQPRPSVLRTQNFPDFPIDSGGILRRFVNQVQPFSVVPVEFRLS